MVGKSILDVLPPDILDLVIRETRKYDRKHFCGLRMVCKKLNELVEPQAFSIITINFAMDDSEKWKTIPEFLSSLASGTSPYVRWAKELRLVLLVPNQYRKNYHDLMSQYDPWQDANSEREMIFACQKEWPLLPAIESLVQVERVILAIESIQPYHDALCAVSKLPRLRNFGIMFRGSCYGDIPLEGFSNLSTVSLIGLTMTPHVIEGLKRLLARCPSITDLALCTSHEEPGDTEVDRVQLSSLFEDVLQLPARAIAGATTTSTSPSTLKTLMIPARRFVLSPSCAPFLRALTSLSILTDSAHVQPSFWKSLQDSGICLQGLKVGPLLQPVVDYLLSYSGVRDLKLDSLRKGPENAENITHQFFHFVLPMHQSSIKSISFQNPKPGSWAITQSYLDGVLLCKNLESLNLVYHSR